MANKSFHLTTYDAAELLEAQQRTIRFGLSCPKIPSPCGRLLTPERHDNFPTRFVMPLENRALEACVVSPDICAQQSSCHKSRVDCYGRKAGNVLPRFQLNFIGITFSQAWAY
ncbi:hypothetical protein FGKAn22_03790 [Ferrigenium kumadai]|uniref:Uncharacterized protein n=1 Tax=Ferrigenium kumadai TaxID=1682490 RepID=A0AAN1SY01_9PROT|nr:hypothetical protein FGKAn22_03790 [Ferrigenium kumadai]